MVRDPVWLHEQGDSLLLDVYVVAGAAKVRMMGVYQKRLKIQLRAPALKNQANKALIAFIAELFGVSKAQATIVGGLTSKRKTLRLHGVKRQRALLVLSPYADKSIKVE